MDTQEQDKVGRIRLLCQQHDFRPEEKYGLWHVHGQDFCQPQQGPGMTTDDCLAWLERYDEREQAAYGAWLKEREELEMTAKTVGRICRRIVKRQEYSRGDFVLWHDDVLELAKVLCALAE